MESKSFHRQLKLAIWPCYQITLNRKYFRGVSLIKAAKLQQNKQPLHSWTEEQHVRPKNNVILWQQFVSVLLMYMHLINTKLYYRTTNKYKQSPYWSETRYILYAIPSLFGLGCFIYIKTWILLSYFAHINYWPINDFTGNINQYMRIIVFNAVLQCSFIM